MTMFIFLPNSNFQNFQLCSLGLKFVQLLYFWQGGGSRSRFCQLLTTVATCLDAHAPDGLLPAGDCQDCLEGLPRDCLDIAWTVKTSATAHQCQVHKFNLDEHHFVFRINNSHNKENISISIHDHCKLA